MQLAHPLGHPTHLRHAPGPPPAHAPARLPARLPAAVDDDASYFSPDEDQLSTTPLLLLQAIDLYLARLRSGAAGGSRAQAALPGAGLRMSAAQLQGVLWELRDDVEAYWQGSDSEGW